MIRNKINKAIKKRIIDFNMTQRELSVLTEIPEATLSLIICGHLSPTLVQMRQISRILDSHVDDLFVVEVDDT